MAEARNAWLELMLPWPSSPSPVSRVYVAGGSGLFKRYTCLEIDARAPAERERGRKRPGLS